MATPESASSDNTSLRNADSLSPTYSRAPSSTGTSSATATTGSSGQMSRVTAPVAT